MGGFSVNSHFQDMADLWKCRTTEDAPLLTVPLGFLTLKLVHIEHSEILQLFGLSRVSSLPYEVSVHKCPFAPLSLCAPPCVSSVGGGQLAPCTDFYGHRNYRSPALHLAIDWSGHFWALSLDQELEGTFWFFKLILFQTTGIFTQIFLKKTCSSLTFFMHDFDFHSRLLSIKAHKSKLINIIYLTAVLKTIVDNWIILMTS